MTTEQVKQQPLFQKTKVMRDFSKLSKLLYGWPKSGKTTFAAQQVDEQGREPLFIATEDGHHALEVYALRVEGWEGFRRAVTYLKDNAAKIRDQHSCLVVDLVSDLDGSCAEYVAKQNNVKHVADMEYGKGFGLVRQEFQGQVRQLFDILPITFIAHSQEKDLQWNNEKIKVQAPSLSKGCLEFVNGKVDVIAMILPANTKKELPEITMRSSTTSVAGSRYKQLARSFTLYPHEPARTYREIQKVFAGENLPPVQQVNANQEAATAGVVTL